MIHLRQVTKQYAEQNILNCVTWQLNAGERIGLCGENGAGKTTLLRVLAGEVGLEKGFLQKTRETTIGYLPQSGLKHAGQNLFDEVFSAFDELFIIEKELQQIESQLSGKTAQSILERYALLQEQFRREGGYSMEAEVGRILMGLGFSQEDWHKPCASFSGGWQMRIALAKLLIKKPTLMLLDEPTNHLDLPARNWLENYLANYPHTLVLVSHDRFFLDQVVTKIVEIWHGHLTEYPGNYSRYLSERNKRIAALRVAKHQQDEQINKIETFIEKFRFNANKAALVQSRIKKLKKIERIEVPPERKRINFTFPPSPKGGQFAVSLQDVSHGYDTNWVLEKVNLTIERRNRVALVGANGAGKSTLMRLLAGVETPKTGHRTEGVNLHMAFFAQDQAMTLDPDLTVLEQITQKAPFDMVPKLRNLLAAFLFHAEDVHKKISFLSGGEKNRLALAILLLRPANLLLLDEPTNHLDLASKEVLLDALKEYQGTLVFVSHDRYFVDSLSDRIIEVAGQGIAEYDGNYGEFLRIKASQGDQSHSRLRVEQTGESPEQTKPTEQKLRRSTLHAERKASRREHQRRIKELDQTETHIEKIEKEIADLDGQMHDPSIATDHEKLGALAEQLTGLQVELEKSYQRWESLQADVPLGDKN
ncbi:MAG: ABC-F family ATP-binding cassette domain-containing protein [Deltaproteobacteria bacterium]|jgi:ATP-binding cassette subfamily F protein 3|nr:ABC-F family ATP-binding cassette domain-containing protein [Deltaproteobacteria bacterium]